ncbi:type I glutamate--ammonia ligase [bacterium]|nr:type I glutamate--ammonia ligase [bacterium]
MFAQAAEVLRFVEAEGIRMVDLKICDLPGRWHHVTLPAARLTAEVLAHGVGIDTSSYPGYKAVEAGDMRVVPDLSTGMLDPFCAAKTLSFICSIVEPISGKPYGRDPRGVAVHAREYFSQIVSPGEPLFSPELEFYVFSNVQYTSEMNAAGYMVDSQEAPWNRGADEAPNLGHKIPAHGGYHAAPPRDQLHDLRTTMLLAIEEAGVPGHYHHHEVGAPGQVEIEVGLGPLLDMADGVMKMKHIVRNVAHQAGLSATFMPKPMFGEAGNGMHVHQYVSHAGKSLFWDSGPAYAHLSPLALHWVAGLLQHAPALLALCSPSTNSYRRLVPGYEAPISCFYGLSNRTAAIRVPAYAVNERENRIEFRPPDATCNPYLCLAAMTMAGLDGVRQALDPAALGFGPFDTDVVKMAPDERARIAQLPTSLDGALSALEADHEFLLAGGVFTEDIICAWIALKRAESAEVNLRPHPQEYVLYYDL